MAELTWVTVLVVIAALAIDWFLGEPPNAVHPVVCMGKLIRKLTPDTRKSPTVELALGGGMALFVPVLFACSVIGMGRVLNTIPWAGIVVDVLGLTCMLSLRGLVDAGRRMVTGLAQSLDEGRKAMSWLCSRDPSDLTEPELIAATVESIAENSSDSVIAPLFYYALFGLPGAVAYRAINTMDAMIGYRGRFEYLGKAAARLDDLANIIPARLTALLLLAGGMGSGGRFSVLGGWRAMIRDHTRTESPNAGWPMAAMAGLLNVTLEKTGHYRLGPGSAPQDRGVIAQASRVIIRGTVTGLVLLCVVIGGLNHGG